MKNQNLCNLIKFKNSFDVINSFSSFRTYLLRLFPLFLNIIWSVSPASSQEYFQQEVNYKIHVTLNDKIHELSAHETVEYINNSPDTLRFLFFHLWPNAYSDNKTGLARQLINIRGKEKLFNDPELRGYIDSLDFKVEGRFVRWNLIPDTPDICRILLNIPAYPGDTLIITTPFHVKIPKGVTSRLGHIGESYQITQWYPKPAVYDRSGWHPMEYLDQGEFYSEFGKYDVSIRLPANYIVGASGNLENIQEAEWLDKLAADTAWKRTNSATDTGFPVSYNKQKTLEYTGVKIHDFAWFADKRFHVLKGKVKLPVSGKEVTTFAMFTDVQADLWKNALQYVNNSILYFSNLIGDYPYNTFTAVQSALNAGAGMEYPGITVIGIADDAYSLDEVIAHEVCHNWFYAALGSDERRYPFMDEGITSAYEERYMYIRYPEKKLWEVYFKSEKLAKFFHIYDMPVQRIDELEWLVQARRNLNQPVNLPATDYSESNYGVMIYYKTGMGFNYLRAFLGDSVFDSAMHQYYLKWKFRHPQPNDIRSTFESYSGKDLTWFFSDFLGTTKGVDYKIAHLRNQQLLIKNNGELASPLLICGMTGDSIYFKKWIEGFEGHKWIKIPGGNYSGIRIDPMHDMPELYRLNNNIRKSGIFPKSDPIRFQFYFTIEDPDKRSIMFIPLINWNREDGFMVGMTLHNGFLLPKHVEYFAMPFYSLKNPALVGYARISFTIAPWDNFIRLAKINVEGSRFGAPGSRNYLMAKIGSDLYFKNSNYNNPINQMVFGYYNAASDLLQIELPEKAVMRSYLQFGYKLEKTSLINPFTLLASSESEKSFQKVSMEFKYKYNYYGMKNGLEIRLFTGMMLKSNSGTPFYSLSPSGRSGREQYLYQGTYPDRFSVNHKTFWSRQMTLSEGGLVSPVNDSLGFSRWLISLTLTSTLPGPLARLPVKPFASVLLNDHGSGRGHNSPFFCEAGLKTGIWGIFEIYVPLLVSANIGSITGSFKDRIRIVLRLDSFSLVKLTKAPSD